MKIGLSSFVLQGGKTGIATYITSLLANLPKIDQKNEYQILVPACDIPLMPAETPNLSYYSVPSYLAQPVKSILWHNTVLPSILRKEKIDLLHLPSARRVPISKPCKYVTTVHDLATWAVAGKYGPLRSIYNHYCIPPVLRRCDHIIAVSHHTKSDLVRLVGFPEDKITVIYPGVDQSIYYPIAGDVARGHLIERFGLRDEYLVYISRIEHPGKNHINLIKAFEELKKKDDFPYKLVLAGASWNGADVVKSYVKQSPYCDDIVFLGYVSTKDIVSLYSACKLMVHPSFYEGFGFPVIEALACGAQVICSGTSSLKELAKGRLNTFDPRHPSEIAQEIEHALANSPSIEERAELKKFAASFRWEETAKQVLEVYERV